MLSSRMDTSLSPSPILETDDVDSTRFHELFESRKTRSIDQSGIDLRRLTAYQRALLTLDGTVTQFIEISALEPIDVIRLQQEQRILTHEHDWLQAGSGTDVVAREVFLRGRHSGALYVYALSLLISSRIPGTLIQNLDKQSGGIGRILLGSQIENRRELLWFGRERLTHLPSPLASLQNQDFLCRSYRVWMGGQPIMLINEKFPETLRLPPETGPA